ncbi:MAG: Mrp/NBP35 family ATP-binding protein [Thermoplasmata archaeon]
MNGNEYNKVTQEIENRTKHIGKKIAIASGKGGVGKSTVTALLGSALASRGKKVAIMDADLTGPSIPRILGIKDRPSIINSRINPPLSRNGIKVISMNMFLESEGKPVIWRGPLIGNVIRQFLSETEWGELDFLLIDFPPGTSDVPLTVMQSLKLDGIVIVTTPQELVAMVVEKAIGMANQMDAPILGIVENMSGMKCPKCGEMIEIFSSNSAAKSSGFENIPLLGKLPLDSSLCRACDDGTLWNYRSDLVEGFVNEFMKSVEKISEILSEN